MTYNVDFAIIYTEFDDIFVSLKGIFYENIGDNFTLCKVIAFFVLYDNFTHFVKFLTFQFYRLKSDVFALNFALVLFYQIFPYHRVYTMHFLAVHHSQYFFRTYQLYTLYFCYRLILSINSTITMKKVKNNFIQAKSNNYSVNVTVSFVLYLMLIRRQ